MLLGVVMVAPSTTTASLGMSITLSLTFATGGKGWSTSFIDGRKMRLALASFLDSLSDLYWRHVGDRMLRTFGAMLWRGVVAVAARRSRLWRVASVLKRRNNRHLWGRLVLGKDVNVAVHETVRVLLQTLVWCAGAKSQSLGVAHQHGIGRRQVHRIKRLCQCIMKLIARASADRRWSTRPLL